ncbi:MAG: twin-arginine translocase TatA/TatE family subunit [Bacillota bacterium]
MVIPHIGVWEVILIIGVLLVIFGPRKLPDVGRSLGQTIREFRKSTKEDGEEPEVPVEAVEETSGTSKA